jgi:DNA-binding transcriptional MerR regulator
MKDENEFEKSYYKIKDVADMIGVPQSTLRFWEKEFPTCRPIRSPHNIRYYKPEDIETLKIIHYLIKVKGLKIDAAKEQMRVNKHNISKRMEIIERLSSVRNELSEMLKALNIRK